MKLSRSAVAGAAAALVLIFGIVVVLRAVGNNTGYAPEQPIPFSHRLHAGDVKIPCLYCHTGADRSRHATVPSTDTCMNCHSVVKTESPHIQAIKKSFDAQQPIEWIKVHDLPDHVAFNHQRHLLFHLRKAGEKEIKCEECHGKVDTMERVTQVKTLMMGVCVDCHRERKVAVTCETCHQ